MEAGHQNPDWRRAISTATTRTMFPFESMSVKPPRVEVNPGNLALGPQLMRMADGLHRLAPEPEAMRKLLSRSEAHLEGEYVYSNAKCASAPTLGCARVGWMHSPQVDVSVLARRNEHHQLVLWPNSGGRGYEIGLLEFGFVSASEMMEHALAEKDAWVWGKRLLGLLICWIGYCAALAPLHNQVDWIPPFTGVAGCLLSIIALGLSMGHAMLVMGAGWLLHHPVMAAGFAIAAMVAISLGVSLLSSLERSGKAPRPKGSGPVTPGGVRRYCTGCGTPLVGEGKTCSACEAKSK